MRMGVFFGGTAVRGPARVADAVGAVERLQPDDFFQVAQLALGAADLQTFAIAAHRDAGRIIAAIFQPPQALDDDRHDPLLADVSHDAAHSEYSCFRPGGNRRCLCELESGHYFERRHAFAPACRCRKTCHHRTGDFG